MKAGIHIGSALKLMADSFKTMCLNMCCAADYYDSVEQTPKTGWKAYLPTAARYVLALVLLVVLDAFWMGLIAPLLGIKYFDIVEGIQVLGSACLTNTFDCLQVRKNTTSGAYNQVFSAKCV